MKGVMLLGILPDNVQNNSTRVNFEQTIQMIGKRLDVIYIEMDMTEFVLN